jgi:periplasmic divalent cation tolerance protein
MRQYTQLNLVCENTEEATKIADALLEHRLIVCAKQVPVESKFWWQGELQTASEVVLLMDSSEDLFFAIEAEVGRMHSYETFVLQELPLVGLSSAAQEWMDENLRPADAGTGYKLSIHSPEDEPAFGDEPAFEEEEIEPQP